MSCISEFNFLLIKYLIFIHVQKFSLKSDLFYLKEYSTIKNLGTIIIELMINFQQLVSITCNLKVQTIKNFIN